jgi:heat shock protein beta-11
MSGDLSAGATIALATCSDARHPPEHALEADEGTFWSTTGLFPQELVVRLAAPARVSKLRTLTSGVRKLAVECCDGEEPTGFRPVFEVELKDEGEGGVQVETHRFSPVTARFVRVVLLEGYGDFAAVRRITPES